METHTDSHFYLPEFQNTLMETYKVASLLCLVGCFCNLTFVLWVCTVSSFFTILWFINTTEEELWFWWFAFFSVANSHAFGTGHTLAGDISRCRTLKTNDTPVTERGSCEVTPWWKNIDYTVWDIFKEMSALESQYFFLSCQRDIQRSFQFCCNVSQ